MFSFFGAFTEPHPSLADQFLQRWPDVNIVEIREPFHGLAVRFQETAYVPSEEDLPKAVSAGVQEISRRGGRVAASRRRATG